ncbi:DUF3558 domain-containing protein [Rhodococcus sp. NPDC078407]|uniref:DUF3558 domain-containing protein n=1 Tax=Rhodococcus sp. NPDC078407 TaxID=3364509 RepID=UPI0037CB0C93
MRVRGGGRRAALCAAALVLTSCAESTQGSPVASEDSSTESTTGALVPGEPFDPCTIPKSAVTASGLDVSTERPDFAGITTYPGWKNCTWDGLGMDSWYYVSVMSSINSMAEYLSSPQNDRQIPVMVGSRNAVQMHATYQGDPPDGCAIAIDASGNLLLIVLDTVGSEETMGDPCQAANKHAGELEPFLPK